MEIKNIKILLIILLLFLITGCTSSYTLKINKDFSLEENLVLEYKEYDGDVNELKIAGNNLVKNYLKYAIPSFSYTVDDKTISASNKNIYQSIEDYLQSDNCKNFECKILREDYVLDGVKTDYKTFQLVLNYDSFMFTDCGEGINICPQHVYVNLIFPYKVIKTNAKVIKDNKLTWDLIDNENKAIIDIIYNPNELYGEDVKKNNDEKQTKMQTLLFILGGIIGFLTILFITTKIKTRKEK